MDSKARSKGEIIHGHGHSHNGDSYHVQLSNGDTSTVITNYGDTSTVTDINSALTSPDGDNVKIVGGRHEAGVEEDDIVRCDYFVGSPRKCII